MDTSTEASACALVLVDFVNDIVSAGGKLAGKGYASYIERHGTAAKVSELLTDVRSRGWPVFHVRVGFSTNYIDHPANSPLFGGAKQHGALALGGWGTEFAEFARPAAGELVVNKHRISAFFGTDLEIALRASNTKTVVLAGCATDLAVQSAARDAHDRDFRVVVVEDACAAATDPDHQSSLVVLAKISAVNTVTALAALDA